MNLTQNLENENPVVFCKYLEPAFETDSNSLIKIRISRNASGNWLTNIKERVTDRSMILYEKKNE